MIVFRHGDPRLPVLWEDTRQPAGRWHAEGDGPANYFSDTPDGAWAEFLRHEEITEEADLATIRRAIWAVEIDDAPGVRSRLPLRVQTGGTETHTACRAAARRLRAAGTKRLDAPSAALASGPSGYRTDGGLRAGPSRVARTIVLFGPQPAIVGWHACHEGRPSKALLGRVRHLHIRRGAHRRSAAKV